MSKVRDISNTIIDMHNAGKSYREIQNELNCSKGTIAYHCGIGQKEKSLQRNRDRRGKVKKYIQEYKQSHPCTDCKENYPYWMMDFDHLGDKLFGINHGNEGKWNLEEIKNEINKCEVVCANCHRNRTHYRSMKNYSNSIDVSDNY